MIVDARHRAQVMADLEIVRRGRTDTAQAAGTVGRVVAVKDVWPAGLLHQRVTVETDRGQATIETMASVHRAGRALDFPPHSFITDAPWPLRNVDRRIPSIGRVKVGDVVTLP